MLSDCKNSEWQVGFTGRCWGKFSITQTFSPSSTHRGCGFAGEQALSSHQAAKPQLLCRGCLSNSSAASSSQISAGVTWQSSLGFGGTTLPAEHWNWKAGLDLLTQASPHYRGSSIRNTLKLPHLLLFRTQKFSGARFLCWGKSPKWVSLWQEKLSQEEPTAFTPSTYALNLPTQIVRKFAPQYQIRIFFLAFLLSAGTQRLSIDFRLVDQA